MKLADTFAGGFPQTIDGAADFQKMISKGLRGAGIVTGILTVLSLLLVIQGIFSFHSMPFLSVFMFIVAFILAKQLPSAIDKLRQMLAMMDVAKAIMRAMKWKEQEAQKLFERKVV